MSINIPLSHRTCFISASLGSSLGELPKALADLGVSWQWAKDSPSGATNTLGVIAKADFVIAVFRGSRTDARIAFEIGVAAGYRKRVLIILTTRTPVAFDLSQFVIARLRLKDREALKFHIEAFFQMPQRAMSDLPPKVVSEESKALVPDIPKTIGGSAGHSSALEREVQQIIEAQGGSVITQPKPATRDSYRPGMLVWLPQQEPKLLDPTVIEVKGRVRRKDVRGMENKLLRFMAGSGVLTAFVLTGSEPPTLLEQLSPNIYWLDVERFRELVMANQLGVFMREARNRAAHGIL